MAAMSSIAIGTAVVGGVSALFGAANTLHSSQKAKEAKKEQERAIAEANAVARQKLAFAQDIYKDWQDTYGAVDKKLGEYYANLSADGVKSMIQNAEVSATNSIMSNINNTRQQLSNTFQKQGMGNSGAAAAAEMQLGAQALSAKSAISWDAQNKMLNAGQQVANAQGQFAALGAQKQQIAAGLMNGAFDANMNAANMQMQAANNQMQYAQQGMADGMSTIGSGLGMMASAFNNNKGNGGGNGGSNNSGNTSNVTGAGMNIPSVPYAQTPTWQQQANQWAGRQDIMNGINLPKPKYDPGAEMLNILNKGGN